jgi:hypothetical protein
MSRATVEDILKQIRELTVEDRLLLEARLSTMMETEWQEAADEARLEARRRGLSQGAIDEAVAALRRGV